MDDNYCVVCGAVIPEGSLVCPACENSVAYKNLYDIVNAPPARFTSPESDLELQTNTDKT